MKTTCIVLWICFSGLMAIAQNNKKDPAKQATSKKMQVVEAACGQCKFGLPGKTCDLAVRVNGQAYFVDGTNIDSHGDAHAADGFCLAIRKAAVQGKVINSRFRASYFKLLPDTLQKKKLN